jgi:hypothetical protein
MFGNMIATRAPGSSPCACSQAPSAADRLSSWPYDIQRSMQTENGRDAFFLNDSSSSCVSD